MKPVLIDTNIWSTYLRRNAPEDYQLRFNLELLVQEGRVVFIGPIRQEVLSGIKDLKKFNLLKEYLSAFDDDVIYTHEYELAAKVTNDCIAKGIAISSIDAIIASVVHKKEWELYTRDKDFDRYIKVIKYDRYKERKMHSI
jgi:predicted nucleic acid-binding protein